MLLLGANALSEPVNGCQVRRELYSWQVADWAHDNPGSIYSGRSTLTRQEHFVRHDLVDGNREVAVYEMTSTGRGELDGCWRSRSRPSTCTTRSASTRRSACCRWSLVRRRSRTSKAGCAASSPPWRSSRGCGTGSRRPASEVQAARLRGPGRPRRLRASTLSCCSSDPPDPPQSRGIGPSSLRHRPDHDADHDAGHNAGHNANHDAGHVAGHDAGYRATPATRCGWPTMSRPAHQRHRHGEVDLDRERWHPHRHRRPGRGRGRGRAVARPGSRHDGRGPAHVPRLQSRSRIGPSTWTCSRSSPRPSALSELVTVIGQAPGAH